MNRKRILGLVFVSFLLLPYAAFAQSISNDLRRTMQLKQSLSVDELTEEYMAINISGGLLGDNSFIFFGMMFDMRGGEDEIERMRYFGAHWTKGDVVEIGGNGYLVTYKSDLIDVMSNSSRGFEKTEQMVLNLSLVNLDNIDTIDPLAELTPEKFQDMFSDMFAEVVEVTAVSAQTSALSNVKQLTLGILMYCSDYDDITPYAQSTKAVEYVTAPYLRNDKIWNTGNPEGSKFYFNMAIAGIDLTIVDDPANVVMFYESRAWPDGRRVVSFCDGRAKIITEDEWRMYNKTRELKFKKSAKPLPPGYGVTIGMRGESIPPVW